MTEPTSSIAGTALAAGAITITGSVFGIQFDALLVGVTGSLAAMSYQKEAHWFKVAMGVLLSTLCAGLYSPYLAVTAYHFLPSWLVSGSEPLRIPSAGFLGLTAQALFPALLSLLPEVTEVLRNWIKPRGTTK